jgi:hypothetical protein
MNILSPYDAFNDVHAYSVMYWCLEQNPEPPSEGQHDGDSACDPDDEVIDPPSDTGGGGDPIPDPPDAAPDLGGDEDTPQW